MGKSKKKKAFVDKKHSSTYNVLHRSQRDVGGSGTLSDVVLWPSPGNLKETNERVLSSSNDNNHDIMNTWKHQADQAGLLDDYDYDRHLKPIKGTGDFVDATTGRPSQDVALRDVRSIAIVDKNDDDDVHEVSRQLESIALTADCMDDDIAQALFGDFEETDFEEILDDFCITAAQEPEGGGMVEEQEEEFDFDAHVRSLMERAKKKENSDDDAGMPIQEHKFGRGDHEFFAKAKPLHQTDDDYDDDDDGYYYEGDVLEGIVETPGVVPALEPDEERALCEKFEQTLAEYDSDEVGDLDEECEEIGGTRPLEGDVQMDAALDDFLQEKKDEIFMEGTSHLPDHRRRRTGGSAFSALVGKSMVKAEDLSREMDKLNIEEEEPVEDTLANANKFLANPEMEPPPEEVLIDGKSYFSERPRNPWDCESILSTYSNLDNNPVTIESGRRRGKKKKGRVAPQSVPEEEPVQIRLSNKTGFPIGILEGTDHEEDFDDTSVSVNKGEARERKESAQEKKARKQAVKQQRQIARMEKKMMKEAFKDEFMKRTGDVAADDVGGKSVFRYS